MPFFFHAPLTPFKETTSKSLFINSKLPKSISLSYKFSSYMYWVHAFPIKYNNNTWPRKNGMKECNGRQDWKKCYLYRGIVDKFETHFVVHFSVCQCDWMMNVWWTRSMINLVNIFFLLFRCLASNFLDGIGHKFH